MSIECASDLMKYLTIFCDGNGDGHSIALFPSGQFYIYYEEGATNNECEYNAIITTLFAAPNNSYLIIKTDSQLVCGHLNKGWNVNLDRLKKKIEVIHTLAEMKNITLQLEWIPRKTNIADRALRRHLKATRRAGQGGSAE